MHLDRVLTGWLAAAAVSASARTVGEAYDSALAESVIGMFKTELTKPLPSQKTRTAVRTTIWPSPVDNKSSPGPAGAGD